MSAAQMNPAPAPRAIRHFGLAALEARAHGAREVAPSGGTAGTKPRRVVVRLWLPLTVVFVLLAPLALLLIPFLYLAPPVWRVRPAVAVFAVGGLLLALGGTVVDVDTPEALVRIKIV